MQLHCTMAFGPCDFELTLVATGPIRKIVAKCSARQHPMTSVGVFDSFSHVTKAIGARLYGARYLPPTLHSRIELSSELRGSFIRSGDDLAKRCFYHSARTGKHKPGRSTAVKVTRPKHIKVLPVLRHRCPIYKYATAPFR